jgi:hypothetical protein
MSRRPVDYLEEHLPYEISMLEHTFRRLHLTKDQADWNAFLESFCQHARNLKAFLTGDKGKGNNNVVASDFVSSLKMKTPPKLTGAFQRINEQTNHLAKKRSTDPLKKFTLSDARDVFGWLEPSMRQFVHALSSEDAKLWNAAARNPNTLTISTGGAPPSATNAIQQSTHTTSVSLDWSMSVVKR